MPDAPASPSEPTAPQPSAPPDSSTAPSPHSPAERALAVCGLVLLIGFLLPWYQAYPNKITPWMLSEASDGGKVIWFVPVFGFLLLAAVSARNSVKLVARLTGAAAVLCVIGIRTTMPPGVSITAVGWLMVWVGCLLPVLASDARDPMRRNPKPGRFLRRKAGLVSHWFVLLEDFNTSTNDFYAAIEAEVKQRKLPLADVGHVEFAEGGPLSAERDYLRFRHERLVIDLCAAPYGTDYFFSLRVCELPIHFGFFELLLTLMGVLVAFNAAVEILGPFIGPVVLAVVVLTLAICASLGSFRKDVRNLDDALLRTPLIGAFYELVFRQDTYHRHDTRLMFLRSLEIIVKRQVSDAVAGKGVKLGKQFEFSPLLGGDVYEERPKELSLDLASPIQVTNDAAGA